MIVPFEIHLAEIDRLEEHLSGRGLEIDGRIANCTFADQLLGRLLGAARAERRKRKPKKKEE